MNIKKIHRGIFVAIMLIFCNITAAYSQNTITLDGAWQFRKANSQDAWMPAVVPGTVHTDLMTNGKIPDVYIGCNNMQLGWIDSLDWEYYREFDLPKSYKPKKITELVFEGLDTYAQVYLNDSLILVTDNMFRQWRKDCATILKPQKNSIRVIFSSAVKTAKQKSSEAKIKIPGGEWAYSRKAAYHYGWDWGPRFVTCGIWKSVYIYQQNDIEINDPSINTINISDKNALMSICFEYSVLKDGYYSIQLVDTVAKTKLFDKKINVKKGIGELRDSFYVQNPQLWWPNGMGKQNINIYKLIVKKGTKSVYSKTFRVGVRVLELVNEPDSIGESFYFKVNGKPMFAKGANVIPPHSFISAVTDSVWISIANNARQSNFNMVRIWGGGVYPPNVFFEACTERGILVWQDFMFACSMYPWNRNYLKNVQVEAEQQVKRLRAHTSLALWCGNNEVDEGWHNWGWKTQFDSIPALADSIWSGYESLFHDLLPTVVTKYDSTRPYWPSSPKFGWGRKQSMTHGDSHYWGVWWGSEPFEKYREKVPRFMSEYGYQGAPSNHTIKLFSNGGVNPDSVEMRCHQKHPVGYETIRTYMEREGFYPETFDDWAYQSQITQAIGYRVAIESHRLASPRCMGTLYWQMNDCWPVVSWSSIDYLGHWKAVHYTVRDSYKSVLVSAQVTDRVIVVNAVSDSLQPVNGKITLTILSTLGDTLKQWTKDVLLQPNIALAVDRIENPLEKKYFDKYFIHTRLSLMDGTEFESVSFMGKVGKLQLENPQIVKEITKSNNGGTITLSSKYPAFFVELSSNNSDCRFENNYLHILPGRKYVIKYSGTIDNSFKIKTIK